MMTSPRRRYLALAAILLLLLGGAFLLQGVLFPAAAKSMEVLSVRGEVSVIGASGESKLAVGCQVLPGESVKTGHDGEAVMRGEGSSTITVTEHSSVEVEGVLDGVARLRLDEGRVLGDVTGEGSSIQVRGGKEGASVLTRDGRTAVAVDASGDFSVATLRGTAALTHDGATQELAEGQVAVVSGGKVALGALPKSVLLKVAWPEEGRTRETKKTVTVESGKATSVRVNDRVIAIGPDGKGTIEVELQEGENKIKVEAADVAGNRSESESGVIIVDTRPPDIRGGPTQWR